jgi:hypothetical protein
MMKKVENSMNGITFFMIELLFRKEPLAWRVSSLKKLLSAHKLERENEEVKVLRKNSPPGVPHRCKP